MLTLLRIKNVALIDELSIEFGDGLNLLTGETGSGKSIIVDSLGALTGERVSGELIKDGRDSAMIEGLFNIPIGTELKTILDEGGIETDAGDQAEMIIRRELSAAGKNRVYINNQLVTQGLLKRIGTFLVDIHGQGDQAALYDTETHIGLLDEVADTDKLKTDLASRFDAWSAVRAEIDSLKKDEAEKLQLLDLLRFQVNEIETAGLQPAEDTQLEEEKHRLNNIEKLSTLSSEAFALLYDNAESTAATLEKAQRRVNELSEFESKFGEYAEGIASSRAVIDDLAIALRDFRSHLEFSPERLIEIEDRLAEISRLKRKYGGTVESVLEHLRTSSERLQNIETAEFREQELNTQLATLRGEYLEQAMKLHDKRTAAARKFQKQVEHDLKAVALERSIFEVHFDDIPADPDESTFSSNGIDRVEFYFSANPGESPKPLVKVASGGEASRLMLIIKTAAHADDHKKAAVFDEIDAGIGGRAAEAVGRKLKGACRLSAGTLRNPPTADRIACRPSFCC